MSETVTKGRFVSKKVGHTRQGRCYVVVVDIEIKP